MNRFSEDDGSIKKVLTKVLRDRFSWLRIYDFLPIFDTRKQEVYGNIRLADIMLANEKVRFFTRNNVVTRGYDFVLTVDKYAWKFAAKKDRVRLISHELQHADRGVRGRASIRGHDVEDFYDELRRNSDDPDWGVKLAQKVRKAYLIGQGKKKSYSA